MSVARHLMWIWDLAKVGASKVLSRWPVRVDELVRRQRQGDMRNGRFQPGATGEHGPTRHSSPGLERPACWTVSWSDPGGGKHLALERPDRKTGIGPYAWRLNFQCSEITWNSGFGWELWSSYFRFGRDRPGLWQPVGIGANLEGWRLSTAPSAFNGSAGRIRKRSLAACSVDLRAAGACLRRCRYSATARHD